MAGDVTTATPSTQVLALTCPSCGGAVPIRAQGVSITAVCPHCYVVLDRDNEALSIVQEAAKNLIIPTLEIGKRGDLRGQKWEIIGFMRRCEPRYVDDPWDEYLLYNPYLGYEWLSTSHGHWTLYRVSKARAEDNGTIITFMGETFKTYHRGDAAIQYIAGEFYWQARRGDTVKTVDAIRPPIMLSNEKSQGESIWSVGEYLDPSEIKRAFQPKSLPPRDGVAPHQPSPFGSLHQLAIVWCLAFLVLCFVQMYSFANEAEQVSPEVEVTAAGLHDAEVFTFTNASSRHALLTVDTSLSQAWSTIEVRVVSAANSASSYSFEKDFSYYSGSDEDGSWSEGDHSEEFLLNNLPRGDYKVLVSATPGSSAMPFHLSVRATLSSHIWSNFWLALFLISIAPLWLFLRSRAFEARRWSDSEFNPYGGS